MKPEDLPFRARVRGARRRRPSIRQVSHATLAVCGLTMVVVILSGLLAGDPPRPADETASVRQADGQVTTSAPEAAPVAGRFGIGWLLAVAAARQDESQSHVPTLADRNAEQEVQRDRAFAPMRNMKRPMPYDRVPVRRAGRLPGN